MRCALQYAKSLRAGLDRDYPGWTVELIWCPWHREKHEIISDIRQAPLLASPVSRTGATFHRPSHRPRPVGWCPWHETASPQLTAPCAYCDTQLHVHQPELAKVKSGRQELGYLVERCPACHRYNAVIPAYGLGGIRTSRLADGAPVLQLKLGRA